MRGAEKFGSTEVNNQLTTIKLPSTFPLSKKPNVKTARLVCCKTYTSIAPNNYLVSYACLCFVEKAQPEPILLVQVELSEQNTSIHCLKE